MKLALSMCESGKLQYVSETCCRVRIAYPAPGENEWWIIDLDDYFLPATRLVRQCKLSEEPELAIATVLAVDTYLSSVKDTKEPHTTVVAIVSTIAKCWEWGRLNGIYRVADWTAGHFRALEKQLVQGRWALALKGESRIQQFLSTGPAPDSIAWVNKQLSLNSGLKRMLGTNLSAQELACGRNSIHRYVQPNLLVGGWLDNSTPTQPGFSWLRTTFWHVNLLSGLAAPYALKLTPFPEPQVRAKRLAVSSARTPTLSVDHAIGMLVYSKKCVDQYSGLICDLVYEVGRIAFEADQAKRSKKARLRLIGRLWDKSLVRACFAEILGCDIFISSCSRDGRMTVPMLVDILMSSCFIQIAALNARRKDEVIHKTLGIRRDSMSPINEELGVYTGVFYIEKTLKSYAPYFVNQATFNAYSAMRKLEEAQLAVEALFTGEERSVESMSHSMFWSRSFAPTVNRLQSRVWFTFSFNQRSAGRFFTAAALGKGVLQPGSNAHIFRRFYAIIFLYRFEHGGLLALRYQLAHLNCEMTKQYVTSAMVDAVDARIPIALRRPPEAVLAMIEDDRQALEEVVQEVGREKLLSVIEGLLGGQQAFSGGFPRLVERLHRRLLADLDYSAMDAERQARRLQQRLLGRGHALRPLPHADCAAGTSKARGAKCSNSKGSGLAPENASANICCTCPYSWTSKGHIEGLKLDLKVLDDDVATAPPGTLLHDSLLTSRVNLQQAIWLHEERINRAH
ncbi:hypothetical protein [Comamonas testosteroni]|uniref:hypothetical protein n=1 Tax=Comamonas testosteroni TaxID=285 RepID=UPI0026E9DAE4|nr:hypothetical protein [Comamonas testosteroni]